LKRLEESPKNRLVFIDLTLNETPVEEVCKRYGISRTNADTIKHRVKKKLEPIIEELRNGLL